MQKYKSNITTTSGAAVRGVPVLVIDEDGNNAALFLDRAGTVPAQNPLTTGPDGVFYFYAANGRYSIRTTVEGVTITDDDVVLMMDPEEITVAGPIAEAVAAAQAAAIAAEFAVEASGIPDLVAAAQNSVVDSNNAVTQANSAANNAAISKTGADSARDAAVIAKNAAEAALDSFDDRYLGAKAVAPTADNDGAALLTGALYWDTALPGMRSWNGSAWVTLPAATAASISNTPAGSIAATSVQGAINELATERYGRDNILGTVSQSAGVPTGAVIERGSNANGEYVRFADGTQICTIQSTFTQAAEVVWSYPAIFAAAPNYLSASINHFDPRYYLVDTAMTGGGTSATIYRSVRSTHAAVVDAFLVNCVVIGRWF